MPYQSYRHAKYTAGQKRFSTISHFRHDADLIKINKEFSHNPKKSSCRVKQTFRAEPRRSMNGIVECSTALLMIMALAVAARSIFTGRPRQWLGSVFSTLGIVTLQ